ncbi:MAG TPA: trypsin-like serine protease [Acidimicrobiia bacterium]|nr:trypsin-like serine protease [Acidimicrobiia bacterium]
MEGICIRRTVAVVVVAVSLGLGTVRPADGVVGGTADGENHNYVGALLGPLGVPFCSGVLVASSRGAVLLTTAHCLGPAGEGTQVTVGFGPTAAGGLEATGTFHVMAGYDAATGRNDVALVAFPVPPPIRPVRLGTAVPPAGTAVTTVGYGRPSRGVRTYATEIVVGSDPTWLYLEPGSGNSCDFDSGGPDLLDAVAGPTVVALTDRGTCSSDQDYLVTGQAVHDFVDWPALTDPAAPGAVRPLRSGPFEPAFFRAALPPS